MLKKRSVTLAGHATSVALEPEFWAVLDRIAAERNLSQTGLLVWIDKTRGRLPLASACRLLALEKAGSEKIIGETPP
jgi:predicted DNA-binding ribbon-helix-helix protein